MIKNPGGTIRRGVYLGGIMEKFYRIAGLTVKMDSFGRTVEQAVPYEIDPCDQVDITITWDWRELQERYPKTSDDICEYLFSGSNFYTHLLKFDGLMLHSSAVVMDGKAYLFTADCGTGKSTHTGLWLKAFGDRAFILNDDKPALRLEDGVWYAYGTPWSGKHDISVNTRVPLGGIAVVNRCDTNWLEPMEAKEAVFNILRQTSKPRGMEYRIKMLELLDQLITRIPVWKLHCNMDVEAAQVAFKTMSARTMEE